MKKRRELDALVNGKMGRQKKAKKGQHELLRNDSESSEIEEFSIPQKTVVRKRQTSRICATCLMACGFFLLVACLVTVGGLVFIHIKLQKDVDSLQSKLDKATGAGSDLASFQAKQDILEKTVNSLKSGDHGMDSLSGNISGLVKQINKLNITADYLKGQLKNLEDRVGKSPTLESLPENVDNLQKNVAAMGSNLATLQVSVNDLTQSQNQLSSRLDALDLSQMSTEKEAGGRSDVAGEDFDTTDLFSLKAFKQTVDDWNRTLTEQMTLLMSHSHQHLLLIQELDNKTMGLDNRLSLVELRGTTTGLPGVSAATPDLNTLMEETWKTVVEHMDEIKNMTQGAQDVQIHTMLGQIEQLTATVNDLQLQIQELPSADGSSIGGPSLTNLTQRFTELKALLEQYRTVNDAGDQAANSSLYTLTQRVSTVESDITTLGSRVVEVEVALQDQGQPRPPSADTHTDPPAPTGTSLKSAERTGQNSDDTGEVGSEGGASAAGTPFGSQEDIRDETHEINVDNKKDEEDIDNWPSNVEFKEAVEPPTREPNSDEYDSDSDESSYYYDSLSYSDEAESSGAGLMTLIRSQSVKTPQDLARGFRSWDADSDGFVVYEDLAAFLPELPSSTDLQAYDKDGDRQYSLLELAAAFGFTSQEMQAITTTGTGFIPKEASAFQPQESLSRDAEFSRSKRWLRSLNKLFNTV